jgi:transcriptional regulator with XRE-family HTH domain
MSAAASKIYFSENDSYGAWLAEKLEKANVSQAELGRRLGLSREKINRILKGARKVSHAEALRIEQCLVEREALPVRPAEGVNEGALIEFMKVWSQLDEMNRAKALQLIRVMA